MIIFKGDGMVEACYIHGGKNRNAYRIVMEKPEEERPLGRRGKMRD